MYSIFKRVVFYLKCRLFNSKKYKNISCIFYGSFILVDPDPFLDLGKPLLILRLMWFSARILGLYAG